MFNHSQFESEARPTVDVCLIERLRVHGVTCIIPRGEYCIWGILPNGVQGVFDAEDLLELLDAVRDGKDNFQRTKGAS